MQSVGASWLMLSLAKSADMVALVQASTSLPIMLLSLLAGAMADNLDRIRPLNDLVLAGTAQRLHADAQGALTAAQARRQAFVAYTSVIGLLSMKALVESADDPLIHQDTDMIDTLVAVYRQSAPSPRPTEATKTTKASKR